MESATLLLFLLALLALAYRARFSIRERPTPRRKPGESEGEAHVILLGTFRIYSWLVWANLLLGGLALTVVPLLGLLAGITVPAMLLAVRVLYWRLGYDDRRTWMFLGHLTVVFLLTEYFYALRRDVYTYLYHYEQNHTLNA